MLTPPARWCLLEGTILIGWYRNGNRKNHPPSYFRKQDGGYFINGLNSVLFLCLIFEFIKSITIYANHCALADEGVWINL